MPDTEPLKPMTPCDYVANCIALTFHFTHISQRQIVCRRIADIINTAAEMGFKAAWEDARSLAEEAERGAFGEKRS